MRKIPMAKPQIGREEIRNVKRVLKSLSLAQGPEVKAFENEFSKIVGDRECVAVNSGTSALHLALIALGITSGDEVLLPSFTFAATANVVKLVNATPVFVDIDPKTYCIDPDHIENKITKNTRAIIVVHLYGLPANMLRIKEIAQKYSILLIEDASQAHKASINGKLVGTFGDAAAFSFYPTKNITSGEGGMIVLSDAKTTRTCKLLRNQGMEMRYQNEIIGFNLRMTDIHAAIGRVQLRKIDQMNDLRISNASYLSSKLEVESIPVIPIGFKHVFHQYTIRIKQNRDIISSKLVENGIGNDIYYPIPVHRLSSFNSSTYLPNTEEASNQVLSLPVHPGVSKKQLKRIVYNFNHIIQSQKI